MKALSYRLTPKAAADLESIWDYIAADDLRTANRVFDEIVAAILRLAEFPESGHVREDLTDLPLRFASIYSYLIVYRPETKPLEIVRVVSGYRDVARILRDSSK